MSSFHYILFSVVFFKHLLSQNITSLLPDCSCISGWGEIELDCTSAIENDIISTLETFLTLNTYNCLNNCNNNFECQQSLSLLTQYYQYCPLGIINENIIRSYYSQSTCINCRQIPKYHNNYTDGTCISINNCSNMETKTSIILSIDDIYDNCADSTPSPTDTDDFGDIFDFNETTPSVTGMECPDECEFNWFMTVSYQRQCFDILHDDYDYSKLQYLYDDNLMDCNKDCNVEYDDKYDANCDNIINEQFQHQLEFYGALDITSIMQKTKLCFYGLNVNDPTKYELVCIERKDVNDSGIVSFDKLGNDKNIDWWSNFGIGNDMDQVWILACGALIVFMQLGFTLLEAGSVKAGNVQNILFKNIMDACFGAIVFYIVGYCVAYGNPESEDANGFIGVENILIEDKDYSSWFFQFAFACTAATIVSGAVAERMQLEPYFIYTIIVSSWIYPVVVHWIWSENGWLSPFNTLYGGPAVYGGAIDFAGSSAVHMVGGFCGLCGAYILGPRFRRFSESPDTTGSKFYMELKHQFKFGHNVPYQVLGLLILWFGFYGFNPGSTMAANNGAMDLASKVAVNTTLSAAAGGITCAFASRIIDKFWFIPRTVNGILAALASITASCAVVSPGFAVLIGFLGSLFYYGASVAMESKYIQIDDPLDAFAVHGIGGLWGVISAALFCTDESLKFAQYPPELWRDTNWGQRFAANLTLAVVTIAWVVANSYTLFKILDIIGILRVSNEIERSGLDIAKHGGVAVNMSKTYADVATQHDIRNKKKKGGYRALFNRNKGNDDDESDDWDDENTGKFAKVVDDLEKRFDNIGDDDDKDNLYLDN